MKWIDRFEYYVHAMSWGQGYGGENYWREEEQLLRELFGNAGIKRCLSVGCGLFRELEALRRIASEEVTGLEYRQEFVDYAAARLPGDAAGPKLKVMQGDVMALPPELYNHFDLVCVLFHTLTIFPDMSRAAVQCLRAVALGGNLVISVWNDSAEVTAFRRKIYAEMGDKQSAVEYNPRTKTDDIVMYREGAEVHRSPIVSEAYMREALKRALGAELELHETKLTRMWVIHKKD